MKIGKIDLNKEVLVIAEIGNNHEGDIELAKKMISLAASTGVQAVKFQTIVPEKFVTSNQTERLKQLKGFQLNYTQFRELKNVCDDEGLIFLSTPFDIDSVEFLDNLVPAFKIASGDNTFYPLLEKVAATGKPIILSTGMSTFNDIKHSIELIQSTWTKEGIKNVELALLHCNVSYPTPPEDVNLKAIESLKKLGYTVGYSDHSLGIDAAILSIAFGARIIEKHFTFDKTRTTFRDHNLSADTADMKNLIEKIRLLNIMMGSGVKYVSESESENLTKTRRSIASARDLKKGTIVDKDDIICLRPGTGIKPGDESMVIGKKLKKDYVAGLLFEINDLED